MKQGKWLALCVGVLVGGAASGQALNMQPGLWEMTMKVEMSGVPMATGPRTHTFRECLTRDDIEHPWRNAEKSGNKQCSFTNIRIHGNRASYHMKCTGEATSEGDGVVIADSPTSIRETVDATSSYSGMTMKVHTEGTGHRIGPCAGGGN